MIPLLFSEMAGRGMVAQRRLRHKNSSAEERRTAQPGRPVTILTFIRRIAGAIVAGVLATSLPAAERGPVTNLPLPRFVSLKAAEGNVRRGPSLSQRIDWVFKQRNMPLRITAEHGHWRRVEDKDGFGGWMHYSLISGNRTVIVRQDMLLIHDGPNSETPVVAALETGVIAELGPCEPVWCRLDAGGYHGWARKAALWGVAADEIRE